MFKMIAAAFLALTPFVASQEANAQVVRFFPNGNVVVRNGLFFNRNVQLNNLAFNRNVQLNNLAFNRNVQLNNLAFNRNVQLNPLNSGVVAYDAFGNVVLVNRLGVVTDRLGRKFLLGNYPLYNRYGLRVR